MRVSLIFSVAFVGTAALASTPAKADLIGTGSNTIDPIFYLGDKIVGDSEDEGVKTIASGLSYAPAALDETTIAIASGSRITLTNDLPQPYCSTALPCTDTFTGFEFTFTGVDITGISVGAGSSADFTPVALTLVSATDIIVNLTGVNAGQGDLLNIDFTFAGSGGTGPTPTPEPISLAIFGVGLAGVLLARLRKSTSAGRKLT